MIRPLKAADRNAKLIHYPGGISCAALAVAVWTALLACVVALPSEAKASPGYACDDNPCAEGRKRYVENSARRACALSNALGRLLRQKGREQRRLAALNAQLNRCRARRRGHCQYLLMQVLGMNRQIGRTQARINRVLARTNGACRASLPNGLPGNPPTCEEAEASRYCPVTDEQQARQSLQQRCADLEAEKAQQALCVNCIDPNIIAAAAAGTGEYGRLAQTTAPMCDSTVVESAPSVDRAPVVGPDQRALDSAPAQPHIA